MCTPKKCRYKKSKGSVICFCDSDDLWEKKIRNTINEIKRQKYYNFYRSQIFFKKLQFIFISKFIPQVCSKIIVNRLNNKGFQWLYLYNPLVVSSIMLHKEILKNNNFDENINTREDLDLWIRLKKEKYKFYFLNEIW